MNSLGRGDNKKERNKASVMTRETFGMTFMLFGAIMFFIAVTGKLVFGSVGTAITAFFVGLFGFLFYPLDLLFIYLGFVMVFGKKPIPAKWLLRFFLLTLSIFLIVHLATSERFVSEGFGGYMGGCWNAAGASAAAGTGGGVILGLIVYPVRSLFHVAGAYVVFSLLLAAALFYVLMGTPLRGLVFRKRVRAEQAEPQPDVRSEGMGFDDLSAPAYHEAAPVSEPAEQEQRYTRPQPAPTARSRAEEESREILFSGDPASSYRNNLIFSRDSQFNASQRRSSVERKDPPAPAREEPNGTVYEYGAPAQNPAPSYSERYSRQAETARPAMPRKIVPAERVFPDREENYNYPQTPTYRAPSADVSGNRDFYAKDVSPAPAQDTGSEPARKDDDFSGYRPIFRGAPAAATEPAAPARTEPAPEPTRTSRELFRSAFSRPAEEKEEDEPRFGFGAPAREQREEQDDRIARAFDELDSARKAGEDSKPFAPSEPEPSRRGFEPPAEDAFAAPEPETPRRGFEPPAEDTFSAPEPETPRRGFEPPAEDTFTTSEPEAPRRGFEPPAEEYEETRGSSAADLFDDNDADFDDADFRTADEPVPPSRSFEGLQSPRGGRASAFSEPVHEISDEPAPAPVRHVYKKYVCPNRNLFERYNDTVTVSAEEIEHNSNVIVETLAGFHIEAEVVKVTCGSAVTRYDIDIPGNVAVRTVVKRDAEIALRLHARDGVNIYSNSEVGAISIEVPNSVRATVGLRSVMEAEEYENGKPNSLMFAIGKDVEGRNVCGNIVKMKHILVAGSTGSGKSVCLNAMLISLICKYSPEDLRLILIDPKKVEFAIFDGLPHLMINEIIADAQKAVTALNWAIKEMERRYSLFEQKTRSGINVHNLDEYNANLTEDEEKLPKIVIVVDELADLMSVAKKDIEDRIQRLAQKARAAGMHLVIATQRPSVDVITGVIKGNLPTRLAFRVIQEVDSRTILDESGAEKLLGNGDMLYRTEGMFNCLRVQGAFLSSKEVQSVIEEIKANNEAYFDKSVADYINKSEEPAGGGDDDGEDDGKVNPQYIKALGIVVKLGTASISLIQRKCSIGYNHAGKIIEWMEMMHYISPFEGKAKPRTVLLTKEEFESKFGKLD